MFDINECVLVADTEIDFFNATKVEDFLNFLIKIKKINKDTLILGDFFEYYVGKEILYNDNFKTFLSFLKNEGIKIYLIPGNRECLIKSNGRFSENNFYVLDKKIEINGNNQHILLTHGDEILEQDVFHLAFKKTLELIRENNIEETIPYNIRNVIGKILRKVSKGNIKKNDKTLKLNSFYCLSKYDIVVMGHHNFQKEINIKFEKKTTKVYILGNWHDAKPVLIFDNTFKWIKI